MISYNSAIKSNRNVKTQFLIIENKNSHKKHGLSALYNSGKDNF